MFNGQQYYRGPLYYHKLCLSLYISWLGFAVRKSGVVIVEDGGVHLLLPPYWLPEYSEVYQKFELFNSCLYISNCL